MTPPTSGCCSTSRSSAVSSSPAMSAISGPGKPPAFAFGAAPPFFFFLGLLMNLDFDAGLHQVEQLDDVGIGHAHAAVRARLPELGLLGRAMQVDVTAHRVDVAQPVLAGL